MIRSILLCAGRGRRLRPVSDGFPKPALPLLDLPLGAFALPELAAAASPVLVNVSHLGERVLDALRPFGSFEQLVELPEPFGTAGTLAAVRDGLADTFVTRNSDALMDVRLSPVLEAHRVAGAGATIVVRPVTTGADFLIEEGRATELVDRRAQPRATGAQFLGLAVFEKDALAELELHAPGGLTEQVLIPLMQRGALHVYEHDGYFSDVGTIARYLQASIDLLHGRGPHPPRPYPGQIAEVSGGRAYVGPDASVPTGTLGRDAIVLAGASLDPAAYLERSIVMPGEKVPPTRVVDAVWLGEALS